MQSCTFSCVFLFKGLLGKKFNENKIPGLIAMTAGGRMQRSKNQSKDFQIRTLQDIEEGLLSTISSIFLH